MPYRNLQNVDPRVNVLLLEDSAIDADLIIEYLGKSSVPITIERVVSPSLMTFTGTCAVRVRRSTRQSAFCRAVQCWKAN